MDEELGGHMPVWGAFNDARAWWEEEEEGRLRVAQGCVRAATF